MAIFVFSLYLKYTLAKYWIIMKQHQDLSSQLILSEERYRRLFETAQDGILILDASTGLIIDANPFISKLTGYSSHELFNKHLWDLGFFKNIKENKIKFLELQKKGYVRYENLPIKTKAGEINYVEFISNIYLVGESHVIQCNIRDISKRINVEKLNTELNMMYQVILLCNKILLHATTAGSLIKQICKILIFPGGFQACWISHAYSPNTKSLQPIAMEGLEREYFKKLNVSLKDTENSSKIATAIRLNKLLICKNLKKEKHPTLDYQYILSKGYSTAAVIPMKSLKKEPYILVVYGQNSPNFNINIITLLKNLVNDIAFGIDTLDAQTEHLKLVKQVNHSLNNTIAAIAAMVEQRDPYTAGHQHRVSELAVAIATEMGLTNDQITGIRIASVVHDIGKIHVPAEILSKPSKLSQAEYDIIKTHPQAGWEVLKNIEFPCPVAEIVYQHHERLDGSGYPRGLKGNEILLETRIVMVADVIDAMSEHRPYRPAFDIMYALKEIMKQKGKLFDEQVVTACIKLFLEKNYEIK